MHRFFLNSCSDTALNLAVHRQKYPIADLLLEYHANPNISNQAGKTALHRAVVSNKDGNVNHIRTLLNVSFI
jgi:ankyrin repeat protein